MKTQFIEVHSLRDWTNVLDRWYATDGPGVWPDPAAADEVNEDAAAPRAARRRPSVLQVLGDGGPAPGYSLAASKIAETAE